MAHEKEPSSPAQSSPEPRGLLYILFSLFGFLVGRAFSSSYSLTQERIGAVSDSHETGHQGQQPAQEIRIRAELATPEHIEHRTANDDRNYSLQKWLVWGTWLAFVAAGVYAGISLRIWHEMRNQTRIQREASINTERAWLGLDADLPIKISLLKIGPPRFEAIATYRIKNFGHGPAFKIASSAWIPATAEEMEKEWVNDVCKESMDFTEGKIRVGGGIPQPPPMGRMLFPGGVLERPIGQPNDPFIGASDPNLKFLWFIGCITYKDQFGTSHWTRFCMVSPGVGPARFNENVPLHFCGMYNDTDDDSERKKTQK